MKKVSLYFYYNYIFIVMDKYEHPIDINSLSVSNKQIITTIDTNKINKEEKNEINKNDNNDIDINQIDSNNKKNKEINNSNIKN